MAKSIRKNRSIKFHDAEWREVIRAARHESDRRGGDPIEPRTLGRELILRGARRINARAAQLAAALPEMAVAS